jgi:hypothetical protein
LFFVFLAAIKFPSVAAPYIQMCNRKDLRGLHMESEKLKEHCIVIRTEACGLLSLESAIKLISPSQLAVATVFSLLLRFSLWLRFCVAKDAVISSGLGDLLARKFAYGYGLRG